MDRSSEKCHKCNHSLWDHHYYRVVWVIDQRSARWEAHCLCYGRLSAVGGRLRRPVFIGKLLGADGGRSTLGTKAHMEEKDLLT